jgi:membrane protein
MFVYFRAPVGIVELARRTIRESIADDCLGMAAQLAFYFFLALFPALIFFVTLLSYVPFQGPIDSQLQRLGIIAPPEVVSIVQRQLDAIVAGQSGGLLTFAMAGALWSSSTAMSAIIKTLNRAFDVEEFRPFWKTRLVAIGLTIALAVFVILAFAIVLGGQHLGSWLLSSIGLGGTGTMLWRFMQWPLALALVIVAIELVYRFAPNADSRFVWLTPGSLLATTMWLVTSLGFKYYVNNWSSYVAVYGAIGSVIVLMLWFYLSGLALLVGAQLNSEIDHALPTRDRGPHRPGQRRKIGAATEES